MFCSRLNENSRHGIVRASSALLIWLDENVDVLSSFGFFSVQIASWLRLPPPRLGYIQVSLMLLSPCRRLTRSHSSLRSLFNLQFDYAFLLLARNSSSKLGSPLTRLLLIAVKSRLTLKIIPKSDKANL